MTVTKNESHVPALPVPSDEALPAPIARYQQRVEALVDERVPEETLPQRLAMVTATGRAHCADRQPHGPTRRRSTALVAAALVLVMALTGLINFAASPHPVGDNRALYAMLDLLHPVAASDTATGGVRVIVFRQTGPDDALWLIGRSFTADQGKPEYQVFDEVPRWRGSYTFPFEDDRYERSLRRNTALWVMRSYGEESARTIDHLRAARTPATTAPPAVVASRPLMLRFG